MPSESQHPEVTLLSIGGMHCAACVSRLEKVLHRVPGVRRVEVSLATESARVERDASASTEDIIRAVQRAGYEAEIRHSHTHEDSLVEVSSLKLTFSLTAAFLVMSLGMDGHWFSLGSLSIPAAWLQLLIATIVQFWCGWEFYSGAWTVTRQGFADMNTLIALGTSTAYFYSIQQFACAYSHIADHPVHLYFDSSVTIIALILLGRCLEKRARRRATDAISALSRILPRTAILNSGDAESEVPVSSLQIGNRVRVRAGDQIPADGIVVSGAATLDESLLTGESLPVSKKAGELVFGGAHCLNGSLVVELLAVGENALAGEIQRLVAEAASSKAPIQSLADRIAAVFVPIVLGIALATFLAWSFLGSDASYAKGIEFAISVLIIACPCALGLATPVAVIAGIGRAAQFGILIKSGEALQTLASVQTIALDKTGTVTVGRPDLARIVPIGLTDAELLMYAAGAEAGSRHPFAVAVLQHFNAPLPETCEFSEEPGRGIRAIVAGRKVEVVRPDPSSPDLPQLAPNETCVQVWIDESPAGFLVFSDAVREDSAQAIRQLRAMRVEPVMLTGDSENVAKEIAAQLGISHFRARLTPQQKAEAIRASDAGVTAFVGDGINDAAALAAADVGMAMGAGAEAARAAAPVALLRNSLTAAVDALALGRASLRVIKQNLFWAFGYNVILIPTAAGAFYGLLGWRLTPMIAATAMACSSLTVVLNALRLKSWKPPS